MPRHNGTTSCRIVRRAIEPPCRPGDLVGLLADEPDPALLESSAFHADYGRFSLAACRPLEVLTLDDGRLVDRAGHVLAADDEAVWSTLEAALAGRMLGCDPLDPVSLAPHDPTGQPGYLPGWIGYVGYEVGRHIERLPGRAVRDTHMPDLRLAFYDALLVHDAALGRSWLVEIDFGRPVPGAGQGARALRRLVAKAVRRPPSSARTSPAISEPADPAGPPAAMPPGGACPNFTPLEYRRAIGRCLDYIAAGDIFQVNLSQRFAVEGAPPPVELYRALRRRNPAWYAAYLSFQAGGRPCAVISSSPELFLRVRGGRVTTRPIKGTRPRRGDPGADEAAAADLLASPKDNAELAMIIDLLRNDIGRVCRFGSIRVVEPRRLEAHPTVFHLVGTVEGVLREGVGPAGLLRATFPGGSVTGAPKIRAMEIIDELEPCARGVYTGCIGIVQCNGDCEWNIAIRTIVHDAGRALVQVGGGIVADSNPLDEYHETLDKARALLEAIAQAAADGRHPQRPLTVRK